MVWDHIPKDDLSPMMKHYVQIKEENPDCFIFYRLGDFYELFFDDAVEASRLLELTLTTRECGLEEPCPMCGVPHYTLDNYAAKLVDKGHKVCIVEQLEDPKKAVGLVKRGVTTILSPGTLTDPNNLDSKKNNYLISFYLHKQGLAFSFVDISTGDFDAGEDSLSFSPQEAINSWVQALQPRELIFIEDDANKEQINKLYKNFSDKGIFIRIIPLKALTVKELYNSLQKRLNRGMDKSLRSAYLAQIAANSLLDLIYEFRDEPLAHISKLKWMPAHSHLMMNAASRENLEISQNLEDRSSRNTLLSVLDKTRTAMGGRKLNSFLEFPLLDIGKINKRLDSVEALKNDLLSSKSLSTLLDRVYDLERLLSKLSFNRGNARDLLAFASSIESLDEIKSILDKMQEEGLRNLGAGMDSLRDLYNEISEAIVDEPPIGLNEGGMIREGYSKELDQIKEDSNLAKQNLIEYEIAEREKTGIKNLKIVFRKNQGYFIEVTRYYLNLVPDYYNRRQTLKNSERFVTDYLEVQAGRIMGSSDRLEALEYEIFLQLRDMVARSALRIQDTADRLAELDVYLSLAITASENNYVRPLFTDSDIIDIKGGRHPVIEIQDGIDFISNDLNIGQEDNRIHLITGPNMAGKSTYMRQSALIIIMAQMGSFVSADSCSLPIIDKIFTRIGARDRLASGDSTFMVEMKEMTDILKLASRNSFLILDELGRGTSTNDGLAIASSILEYLSDKLQAKTLFATHYHELVKLADNRRNIKNYTVLIEERDGSLIFLRKVKEGHVNRSYGIEVAGLSGLKPEILERARELLDYFEGSAYSQATFSQNKSEVKAEGAQSNISKGGLISSDNVSVKETDEYKKILKLIKEIAKKDIDRTSPMEALIDLSKYISQARDILESNND